MVMRKVIESDLSGQAQAVTITFGLKDTWYEIDLTDAEQKKLETALTTYVKAGRKTLSRDTLRRRQVPETSPEERDEIRVWAQGQGYELADRGRIPKKIMAAYDKAHKIERVSSEED